MFGFFFCLNGLLSAFSAPFGAACSAAGTIASARAQQRAAERAMTAMRPRAVEGKTSIPRVKRRAT